MKEKVGSTSGLCFFWGTFQFKIFAWKLRGRVNFVLKDHGGWGHLSELRHAETWGG